MLTWIGREHELYSGASPISLVEHCVTFRHDRILQSLLGFVHNWPTSRWSATKKENRFSLNGNGIMLSFLRWQLYRFTLYYHPEPELISDYSTFSKTQGQDIRLLCFIFVTIIGGVPPISRCTVRVFYPPPSADRVAVIWFQVTISNDNQFCTQLYSLSNTLPN